MKQDKHLQEFDPATMGIAAAAVLIPLAIQLAALFGTFAVFIKKTKEDPKLSKQLKNILKDGKQWKVMVVQDDMPNAFCMIKPYVFLSSGLIKMMTPREVTAIMLHEAGHITNMDLWKDIIAQNSFAAIVLGAAAGFGGPFALAPMLFLWFIFNLEGAVHVVFRRTMGRAAERAADSFAARFGYGDELISSLQKLEKLGNKYKAKYTCTTLACKINDKIEEIFDEHPPVKERVESILKAKETWAAIKSKSFVQMRTLFQKKLGVEKPK